MTDCRTIDPASRNHRAWISLASIALFACGIAHAQSTGAPIVSAPDSVCTNEIFEVQWSGPDGDGDRITMTVPAASADEASISSPTSSGSPTTLNAPGQPGVYEVRYAEGARRNILARQGVRVSECQSDSSQSGTTDGSDDPAIGTGTGQSGRTDGSLPSGGDDIDVDDNPSVTGRAVIVTGFQGDSGDIENRNWEGPFGPVGYTIDDLCAASDTIGWAAGAIVDRVELAAIEAGSPITIGGIESLPGAPQRDEIEAQVAMARDEVCDATPDTPTVNPFVITYAYCRMAMFTPSHAMDIHLPPNRGDGTMSMADFSTSEVVQLNLSRSLDEVSRATRIRGWATSVNLHSPQDAGNWIGYPITQYQYEYSGGLTTGFTEFFGASTFVEEKGWVAVSDQVPGADIVRSFYQNLSSEVPPDQGGMSFFGGLIKNLVSMLREGLPLQSSQGTGAGIVDGLSGVSFGEIGVSSTSWSLVTDVTVVDMDPAWCTQTLMPPEFEVTDINEQINQALAGSGPGSGAPEAADMAEAMQQYEDAMNQMSPEERQMMERFGIGGMMERMTGGANPAATQAAPPSPGNKTATAASSSPGSSGSSMPPSEELQGENLTETVQKHLEALGYDVGSASGEASLETTIAIAQFQAEKGMEPTGEVSPQLLGVLSAEVDSRR